MKVDNALILAAGAGTRMGAIGKRLPKVLWPVFEKSILELEVLYAKSLGVENIFVNVHHYKDKMLDFITSSPVFDGVSILVEEEKIDIGGAVHNMASRVGYKGNLLILNSDQFICLNNSVWKSTWEKFEKSDVLLFSYEVSSSDLYNALSMENGRLVGVTPNKEIERDTPMFTYTGMALVKLESLDPVAGESKFFETVANPGKQHVTCQNIESSPYWDFGTLKRYWNSVFEILKRLDAGEKDLFIEFLLESAAIDPEKAGANYYGQESDYVVNLTGKPLEGLSHKIVIKGPVGLESKTDGRAFVYEDLMEKL